MTQNLTRQLKDEILRSNYGRECGWLVLIEGQPVAELSDCRSEEMFWDSYLVEPIGDHPETLTEEFWYPDVHQLRNIRFTEFTVDAFGSFEPESNRVTLRLAYIRIPPDPPPPPTRWERILSWFLGLMGQRRVQRDIDKQANG